MLEWFRSQPAVWTRKWTLVAHDDANGSVSRLEGSHVISTLRTKPTHSLAHYTFVLSLLTPIELDDWPQRPTAQVCGRRSLMNSWSVVFTSSAQRCVSVRAADDVSTRSHNREDGCVVAIQPLSPCLLHPPPPCYFFFLSLVQFRIERLSSIFTTELRKSVNKQRKQKAFYLPVWWGNLCTKPCC